MAWIAPVAGGLMSMFGQNKSNQQNQQNSQNATNQAEGFEQKMYNEMVGNLQNAQKQAMGNYQSYLQQNPNPVNTWGGISKPAVLGANGMPQGGYNPPGMTPGSGVGPTQGAPPPQGGQQPSIQSILAQYLGPGAGGGQGMPQAPQQPPQMPGGPPRMRTM